MRIVFVGASSFGSQCVDLLRTTPGIELVGMITAPREFVISYSTVPVTNVLHADLGVLAREWGVPCVTMAGTTTAQALPATLAEWRPDALIVIGWYHLVPRSWREIAPAYGMHASLLPAYRGGAPLVWAIINGERKAGITLFRLDDGIDTGDVVGRRAVDVLLNDTIATVYSKIEAAGLSLLGDALSDLVRGELRLTKQDLALGAVMPQRKPADGCIDWSRASLDIYNFVRAQTRPYPGAFTFLAGERIHLWEVKFFDLGTEAVRGGEVQPGQIVGQLSEGPLRGILVSPGFGDHPLLITDATDGEGQPVPMADGGQAWLAARTSRVFGEQS